MGNNNKKRIHQNSSQKRKVLLEISKGTDAKEIIVNQTQSQDKKYANKMCHKWKKDFFSKKPDMQQFGFGNDLSDIDINYELNAFTFDSKNASNPIKIKKNTTEDIKKGYAAFSNKYAHYNNSQINT